MYLDELKEMFKGVGFSFPDDLAKKFQVGIMELLNKKGYHKAILFKIGFLASAIALKNYDEMRLKMVEAFIDSYRTGKPPQFKLDWHFGENTVCMKLNEADECTILKELCEYKDEKKYPMCELVFASIEEALKHGNGS